MSSKPHSSSWVTGTLRVLCIAVLALTPLLSDGQNPGGISDSLVFWLDAADLNNDGGVTNPSTGSTIAAWRDASGTAVTHDFTDAVDVGTYGAFAQPSYQRYNNAINYNPVVDFSLGSTGLGAADNSQINTISHERKSFLVVFRSSSSAGSGTEVLYEEGGSANSMSLYTRNGSVYGGGHSDGQGWRVWAGGTVSSSAVHVGTVIFNGETDSVMEFYLDNQLIGWDTAWSLAAHAGNIGLGQIRNAVRGDGWNDASANSKFFGGQIAEMVYYNQALSAPEQQQVESYLAIKYGITMQGNYMSSGSQVLWNSTSESVFHNGVTGIGRDDNSGLDQRQSRSSESGSALSIGLGSVNAQNSSNPNAFAADVDFMFWGHDGNAANGTTTGVPAGTTVILERVWQAREPNGDVGATDLYFHMDAIGLPGSVASDFVLLVKNGSSDFTTGATSYSALSLSGDSLQFDDINLADGDRFTIATTGNLVGPGGVTSDLSFWFAADTAISLSGSEVSTWNNIAATAISLEQSDASERPESISGGMNYNPSVRFDGVDEYLAVNGLFYNTEIPQLSAFVVFSTEASGSSSSGNWAFLDFDRSDYWNFFIHENGTLGASWTGSSTYDNYSSTSGFNDGFAHIAGFVFDETVTNETVVRGDGAELVSRDRESTGLGIGNATTSTRYGFVGDGSEAPGYDGARNETYYDGDLSEIILYEGGSLSSTELFRIETYLGIKYGVHLEHDYVSSASTTVWNSTALASHHNEVFGIGRDDGSLLLQRQSTTANGNQSIAIGLQAIAATEDANTGSFPSDQMFLIVGHNGSTPDSETSPVGGYENILQRNWRAREVGGSAGSLELQFDLTQYSIAGNVAGDFALVVKNGDNDFSTGITTYAAASLASDILSFTGIDLANDDFFTVVSNGTQTGPSPGGVASSLELWYASDSAVTTSGTAVSDWGNSAPKSTAGQQTTSTARPALVSIDTSFNFNPSLTFDGTSDYLALDQLNLNTGLDQVITCAVFSTSFSGTAFDNNWALLDFDRSEYFSFYVHGDGSVGFSYDATGGTTRDQFSATTGFNDGNPHVGCAIYDNTAGSDTRIRVDGTNEYGVDREAASSQIGGSTTNNRYGFIGDGSEADAAFGSRNNVYYDGSLAEIMLYTNESRTDLEMQKIESYLAMKYGIHLGGDYIASNDSVIWDQAEAGAYHNDVAIIGRDDSSGLDQRKSMSTSGEGILTVWLGPAAAESSPSAFADDLDFMAWGHEGGRIDTTVETELPSGVVKRIAREWRFAEREVLSLTSDPTGTAHRDVGQLSLKFDLTALTGAAAVHPGVNDDSLNTLRLMVGNTADLSGATLYAPSAVSSADRTVTFTLSGAEIANRNFFGMGGSSESPLPVELVSFNATLNDFGYVELDWLTSAELGTDRFEVQLTADGNSWETIAEVPATGVGGLGASYGWIDEIPPTGTTFYRLRVVDFDGSIQFSPIRVIERSAEEIKALKLAPNPAITQTTISLDMAIAGEIRWELISMQGQIVRSAELVLEGQQNFDLSVEELPVGLYTLRLEQKNGAAPMTAPLVVVRP